MRSVIRVIRAWFPRGILFCSLSMLSPLVAPSFASASQGGPIPPTTTSTPSEPSHLEDGGAESNLPPVRGPAIRERHSRRRGGGAASGALFLAVVVGVVGYSIVKRFRR